MAWGLAKIYQQMFFFATFRSRLNEKLKQKEKLFHLPDFDYFVSK